MVAAFGGSEYQFQVARVNPHVDPMPLRLYLLLGSGEGGEGEVWGWFVGPGCHFVRTVRGGVYFF
jgi:hypothetical protein